MNDLTALLDKAAESIRRDLNHIFGESTLAKLSASSARDLVAYYKLLSDLVKQQESKAEELSTASPEELAALAQELINEAKPTPSSSRAKETAKPPIQD